MDIDRINKLTTPKGEVVRIKRKSDGVTIWRKPYLKLYDWITLYDRVHLPNKNILINSYNWCAEAKVQALRKSVVYPTTTTANSLTSSIIYTGSNTLGTTTTGTSSSYPPINFIMHQNFAGIQCNSYLAYSFSVPSYSTLQAVSTNPASAVYVTALHDSSDPDERYPVMETRVKTTTTGTSVQFDGEMYRNDIKTWSDTKAVTCTSSASPQSSKPLLYIYSGKSITGLECHALHSFTLHAATFRAGAAGADTVTFSPFLKLRPAIKDDQLGLWDEVEERIYPCTSPETALYGYGKMNPAYY